MARSERGRSRSWLRTLRKVGLGARNALEIARMGRLTEPYRAPFEVHHHDGTYRLRRYTGRRLGPSPSPLLLVPPLMVTSEVYDIAEDISAVGALLDAGIDVWLCDFGAPEAEEGGMERTLDDHVTAVIDAVRRVGRTTGDAVHIAGYSQGGMFAYQAAAFLRSEGVASVITFGSPVDIHRSVPGVAEGIAAQMVQGLQRILDRPLAELSGLPGFMTSTGFKLLSVRKEAAQLVDFVTKLHDRQALEKRESRRRFLGGEGFVSWPGPALRTFIDEFIVHNRMMSGGFVIEGRTVTLADIRCPVLYFVGERDDIARPSAVRSVQRAGIDAELFEVVVPTGHFGLVVGSRALSVTWPTVIEWIRWREDLGPKPNALRPPEVEEMLEPEDAAFEDFDFDLSLVADAFSGTLGSLWSRVGHAVEDVGDAIGDLRWQVPRLRELEQLHSGSRISLGKALADKAKHSPEATFFLSRGRAFTYRDADRRVDAIVRGFWSLGVRPGARVAVIMGLRPSYLSAVTALNRIGAAALLIRSDAPEKEIVAALSMEEASAVVTDPERATVALAATDAPVWVLGGGSERALQVVGAVDMEAIDPSGVELPASFAPNAGIGRDLAMVLFTPSRGSGQDSATGSDAGLRSARVTNGRWAFSALGTAAACTLSPDDTVYAALPFHHAAGILVTVGGALVGGARLALADHLTEGTEGMEGSMSSDAFFETLDADRFWSEVRRYGATVVFYAGEMCRALILAPFTPRDITNPVRLFAGSGMRTRVWRDVQARYECGVLEFYASTEVNAVMANASGEKVGSVGRPLPGSVRMELVRWDFTHRQLVRDLDGFVTRVGAGEPGVLLAELDATSTFDDDERIVRDVLVPGDRYFVSQDVLRRDAEGDHFFLGRVNEMVDIGDAEEPVSLRRIEDALDSVEAVALPVVCRHPAGSGTVAYIAIRKDEELPLALLTDALTVIPSAARPELIHHVELAAIPLTEGVRPIRGRMGAIDRLRTWRWSEGAYQ